VEHTISIKRRSVDWVTGDTRWMDKLPLYDLHTGERLEDVVDWAASWTLDAVRRDLGIQLQRLFRQSGIPTRVRIIGGEFKVTHEVQRLNNSVVVELELRFEYDA
jgi:hypothetical protein